MYKFFFKRTLDFFGALVFIILLLPFLLMIILFIRLDSKGSAFFLQDRFGKDMKIFKIIKFRTMVLNAEKMGDGVFTTKSDPRVTKIGLFLRKYSLDEIPQIFNIFWGKMSFIGPRPVVTYHPYKIDEYPEEYKRRFLVKPGVTGWAQVNGRTNLTWTQRFKFDLEYIDRLSLIFDVKIGLLTIKNIIIGRDVFVEDDSFGKAHLE